MHLEHLLAYSLPFGDAKQTISSWTGHDHGTFAGQQRFNSLETLPLQQALVTRLCQVCNVLPRRAS